jgi:hypothetical protein
MSTLSAIDREVVRAAVAQSRGDLKLVRALTAPRVQTRKNRRRRIVALSPLAGHCLYCGGTSTKKRGVCHGHSDLPPLDMQFDAALHRVGDLGLLR